MKIIYASSVSWFELQTDSKNITSHRSPRFGQFRGLIGKKQCDLRIGIGMGNCQSCSQCENVDSQLHSTRSKVILTLLRVCSSWRYNGRSHQGSGWTLYGLIWAIATQTKLEAVSKHEIETLWRARPSCSLLFIIGYVMFRGMTISCHPGYFDSARKEDKPAWFFLGASSHSFVKIRWAIEGT